MNRVYKILTTILDDANPPAPLSLSDLLSGRRTPYIRLLDLMLDKGAGMNELNVFPLSFISFLSSPFCL